MKEIFSDGIIVQMETGNSQDMPGITEAYNRHHQEGARLYKAGKVEDALREYDRAIMIGGEQHAAWAIADKGDALLKLGRTREAVVALEKATELLPEEEQEWVLVSLGDGYQQLAEEAFKRSESIPTNQQLAAKETELPFADAEWKLIPFEEMDAHSLKPFDVITDIPTITAFNDVEAKIGHAIIDPHLSSKSHSRSPDDRFRMRMSGVMGDTISNHVRPKGFHGSLLNSRAVILPFDPERAVTYKPQLRNLLENSDDLNETTPGLSVIYTGDLRSSGGVETSVLLEAIYFDRTIADPDHFPSRSYSSATHLLRALGPNTIVNEAAVVMGQGIARSQEKAASVASFSLRHVYGAGAPGLGK